MNKRHGGPADRGSADAYYGRSFRPHYYVAGTGTSPRVEALTPEEVEEYREGYAGETDRKNWD